MFEHAIIATLPFNKYVKSKKSVVFSFFYIIKKMEDNLIGPRCLANNAWHIPIVEIELIYILSSHYGRLEFLQLHFEVSADFAEKFRNLSEGNLLLLGV